MKKPWRSSLATTILLALALLYAVVTFQEVDDAVDEIRLGIALIIIAVCLAAGEIVEAIYAVTPDLAKDNAPPEGKRPSTRFGATIPPLTEGTREAYGLDKEPER